MLQRNKQSNVYWKAETVDDGDGNGFVHFDKSLSCMDEDRLREFLASVALLRAPPPPPPSDL